MSELAKAVKSTDDARRIFKKILVLPILPAHEISNGFEVCKQEAYRSTKCYKNLENIFENFFDYFERQWLKMVCTRNYE